MRASGILMHISSLPSESGIGTMGQEAYKFVDFLAASRQSYWQILPIGPTGYGDSPYQSFSTHAGNPYFIDFDILRDEGLLTETDYADIDWGGSDDAVDYETIYTKRFGVLKTAHENFRKAGNVNRAAFDAFLEQNDTWISNYALFMSIKDECGGIPWNEWDENLKRRDPHSLWLFKESHSEEIEFWEFIQYKFFEQWHNLKNYANNKGIRIIGDIPIYVAFDSAAVWVHPDLFDIDDSMTPRAVAGCPPDEFSPTGQLWGNPIYNWQRLKETDYWWWLDRLKAAAEIYDIVRIDHFRGFDGYYSIPYGDKTAENGTWKSGPGTEFFRFAKSRLGDLPIIAENLGFLTPSVERMLADTGFPGMKVMEFAFDPDSESTYLPYFYDKNCTVYLGTHDNDTVKGWAQNTDKRTVEFCKKYLNCVGADDDEFVRAFIKAAFSSVGDTVIIQMQDYLGLGSEARMNTPSTAAGNWRWRMKKGAYDEKLAEEIADITRTYGRCANCRQQKE